MGLAKASLESSVRYIAHSLGDKILELMQYQLDQLKHLLLE